MSEYESVSELVNKTGATYNEAKYAYEACGGDMLAAVIMLEKAKGIKPEKPESGNSNTASKESFANTGSEAINNGVKKAGKAFGRACGKRVRVTGNRDFFDMPLPAFVVIFAAAWEFSMPAFIISLICGVKYTLSGEDAEDVVISLGRKQRQAAENPANGSVNHSGGFTPPPEYGQYWNGGQTANTQASNQSPKNPVPQNPSVQIPRPVQNQRPMEYAGGNPLDSEDKGFFN
ncbi:MAG: hypothetical protein K2K57_03790 [Oscillospiraceae bacterium]|nr:hypothetical protein [Oscillospiraceae bacterium]